MRINSVYDVKRKRKHKGKDGYTLQKIPRLGTRLRELYELLQMNKGVVLDLPLTVMYNQTYIDQLQDFYGLDIRRIGYVEADGKGRRPGKWVLAGEWFGDKYIDYIAKNQQKLTKVGKLIENIENTDAKNMVHI